MKLLCLTFWLFSISLISHAETPELSTAKLLSRYMKTTIKLKDAPATCWFLGQVQGYSLALSISGNVKGKELFELVKKGCGKCGGENSMNIAKSFTQQEWSRLSSLQEKIEKF